MGSRAGMCVDVGVNLGHTLIKVKLIDPNRPYIGFEPNPQCSQYATELIRVNGFRDCQVIPVGLSNNTQVTTLFAKEDAVDTSASVVPGFRRAGFYQRTQSVPLFRGDDLLADLDDMAVLKVDVEGGELEVIGGLRETIVRLQPHIFCEVLPVFDATTDVGAFRQRRQTELIRQLHTLGYVMFRMLASGGAVELADIDLHRDMALTNYAFVPADAAPEFRRDFSFANRPATG
jgi:FkbM family methyltransferase